LAILGTNIDKILYNILVLPILIKSF